MEFGKVIKTFKSKKGNDMVFRYPKADDFNAVWNFACDITSEDTFVQLSGKPPTEDEEKKWFSDMMDGVNKSDDIYIMVEVNGAFAGNGRVTRGKYRHAHMGTIGISLLSAFRDEGIGTELMRSLIDEAKTLGLRLLTLSCFENNPRALYMYEKLGFIRCGRTPGSIQFKGNFIGEVHFYLPLV